MSTEPPSRSTESDSWLGRRRNALVVLGAAASVALVAGVVLLLSSPADEVQSAPDAVSTRISPTPVPTATPTATESLGLGDIPADFPLDVDQVAMEGDGGEMRGPSATETGLGDLQLCGTSVWTTSTGRLASTATGPEYADIRELRVYVTADEAAEQLTSLRDQLTGCHEDGPLRHAPIEADTGYDTVTWGDYYTDGLGGGPVQFTRVGRAVLGISLQGEFSEASLDGAAEPVTELTLQIAASMCRFTEDGCGG